MLAITIIMSVLTIMCIIIILLGLKYHKKGDYNNSGSNATIASGIILLIFAIIISLAMIDESQNAFASEEANNQCISRGYDNYDTYNRQPFGAEPFGVKCNHISNKKEIVGTDSVIAVIT